MDVADLVLDGVDLKTEEEKSAVMPVFEDWATTLEEALAAFKPFPSLSFEPAELSLSAEPSREAGKSWFIGEY